jgi:hypothetical protein
MDKNNYYIGGVAKTKFLVAVETIIFHCSLILRKKVGVGGGGSPSAVPVPEYQLGL